MNPYVEIMRPNVCVLAVLGVFVGAILFPALDIVRLAIAMAAAFLICAGGNVINDYYDFEIDKINKPKRPMPSGKITHEKAMSHYFTLSAAGLLLALFVSMPYFTIAVFNFMLSTLYAWKLKKMTIIGNVTDSFLASVTFISGGLVSGAPIDVLMSPVLILAFIAFLTTMGREIFKSVEDMSGDKIAGAKTIAVVAGEAFSMSVARSFVILGVVAAVIPYALRMFGVYYIIAVVPCIAVLMYSATLKNPRKAQKTVKIGMFLGIFAFLVGAFTG